MCPLFIKSHSILILLLLPFLSLNKCLNIVVTPKGVFDSNTEDGCIAKQNNDLDLHGDLSQGLIIVKNRVTWASVCGALD